MARAERIDGRAGEVVDWANRLDDTLLEIASVWCAEQVSYSALRSDAQWAMTNGDQTFTATVRSFVGRLSVEGRRKVVAAHQPGADDGRSLHHVLRAAIIGTMPGLLGEIHLGENHDVWYEDEIVGLRERLQDPYVQVCGLIAAVRAEPPIAGHVLALISSWEGTAAELADSARLLGQ
jgi:hypothetical protein